MMTDCWCRPIDRTKLFLFFSLCLFLRLLFNALSPRSSIFEAAAMCFFSSVSLFEERFLVDFPRPTHHAPDPTHQQSLFRFFRTLSLFSSFFFSSCHFDAIMLMGRNKVGRKRATASDPRFRFHTSPWRSNRLPPRFILANRQLFAIAAAPA